jgi:hypothetical protein
MAPQVVTTLTSGATTTRKYGTPHFLDNFRLLLRWKTAPDGFTAETQSLGENTEMLAICRQEPHFGVTSVFSFRLLLCGLRVSAVASDVHLPHRNPP